MRPIAYALAAIDIPCPLPTPRAPHGLALAFLSDAQAGWSAPALAAAYDRHMRPYGLELSRLAADGAPPARLAAAVIARTAPHADPHVGPHARSIG